MVILLQIFVRKQTFLITTLHQYVHQQKTQVYYHLFRTKQTQEWILLRLLKVTLSIIKSLNSTKAHGCDIVSVRMIKMCSESITLPLKIIFQESLKKGKFQEIWKKANVVPVHKKEDKTFIVNYRPISLLPIFGKISERLIYNSLFNYFLRNKLFAPSQSGFLPGDSCIVQLLSYMKYKLHLMKILL